MPPPNLVVNGSYENNSVPSGTSATVSNLQGWTNPTGGLEVWRSVPGMPPGQGDSHIELDGSGRGNQAEQTVTTTQSGRTYRLSFMQSPRPGVGSNSNKFTVYWNGNRVGTITRNGTGLNAPSWQVSSFTVTARGNDRISLRENDSDSVGALIDDVRLVAL